MKATSKTVLVLLSCNVLALILVFIRDGAWWLHYFNLFGSVLFGWALRGRIKP